MFIYTQCLFFDFIIDILSSNLFIALLIFFLGKKYIFDDFIKEKRASEDLSIRKDIVYNLYQIESSILKFKVIYNRYIRSVNEVKKEGREIDTDLDKAFREEVDLLSKIINTDIPVNFTTNIESLVETYFINKESVKVSWSKYLGELKIVTDFIVLELPRVMSLDKFADDYQEFNIDRLKGIKEDFVKLILIEKTIWNK